MGLYHELKASCEGVSAPICKHTKVEYACGNSNKRPDRLKLCTPLTSWLDGAMAVTSPARMGFAYAVYHVTRQCEGMSRVPFCPPK